MVLTEVVMEKAKKKKKKKKKKEKKHRDMKHKSCSFVKGRMSAMARVSVWGVRRVEAVRLGDVV